MALIAEQTKRLVKLHGWIAILLSMLLYTVMLTGTVVVLDNEINHWAESEVHTDELFTKPIDRMYQRLDAQVPNELKEVVSISAGPDDTLRFFFGSTQAGPEARAGVFGRQYLMDPDSGSLLRAEAGYQEDLFGENPGAALARFLVDLHVRLHVPGRWGLYLTGTLGVVMLISAITGILIHRNIIRDLFVTERPGGRVVSVRDRHNLAGVWSLPFALLLSFTGAFLSFAVALGLPVVAMVAFGGDQDAALEAVTAKHIEVDTTPAKITSIDEILKQANAIGGNPAAAIEIHNAARADALVETFHSASGGNLRGMTLAFSGPSGAFLGRTHVVGTGGSAGATLAELTAPLHFGNFAGLTSKIIWVALGAAMTFTIVSGVQLWARRREDDPVWVVGYRAFVYVAWAVPIAMVACCYGYFLTKLSGDMVAWTARAFVLAMLVCALLSILWASKTIAWQNRRFATILGVSLLLLPLVRLQMGGLSLGEAIYYGGHDIWLMDLIVLLCGGVSLFYARRRFREEPQPA
ncbi:MAG: PepSY-associated TM helix domain-containing protein [Pseudomonadota bacterium]